MSLMSWLLCYSQQIFIAFQFFPGVMNFLLTVQMMGVKPWSFIGVGYEIFRKYISNLQNSDLCWLTRGWSQGGHNLSLILQKEQYHQLLHHQCAKLFCLPSEIYTHDLGRVKYQQDRSVVKKKTIWWNYLLCKTVLDKGGMELKKSAVSK